MSRPFYLTTPIYYVNGAPHIGHAYTSIAADVLARWKRLDGYDVHFLTGTDEHGQKVERAARDAGVDERSFTDGVSAQFRAMADRMGISYDDFIRTTEERHKHGAQALWRRLVASGNIYPGHYEGWYAVRDEDFYTEDELVTRPDGTRVAPSGATVEWVREPNYLFRLSAWQERLLAFYDANPDFIGPTAKRNEVLSFVRSGLKDFSVSRANLRWGVPVPDDAVSEGAAPGGSGGPGMSGQVMYVWVDALANYITALGYPEETAPLWRFWPADLHLVGKEIIRFHAVYWPAMLMAAGLPPPRRVFSHGWWTVEGEKMSKSVGNVVDPVELADAYGLDALRFFLLREVPFGGDGDFSRRALVGRMNGELANELGNLAQRTLSQVARNLGGALPARTEPTEADAGLLDAAAALPERMRPLLDRQAPHEALEEVWRVVRAANAYVDHQAPWALRRTDPARMGAVLRVLVDVLRSLATVLQPFMPESTGRMLDQLGVAPDQRSLAALGEPLAAGTLLPPPQGVFPRHVEDAA